MPLVRCYRKGPPRFLLDTYHKPTALTTPKESTHIVDRMGAKEPGSFPATEQYRQVIFAA